VRILSIAEKYVDINVELNTEKPLKGELNTYDVNVLKTFMDQFLKELELTYVTLDNRFKSEKDQFFVELKNYRLLRKRAAVEVEHVAFISRVFEMMLELYRLSYTHEVLRLKEKIEKLTDFMYNENVISKTYVAGFLYELVKIDDSTGNLLVAIEKVKKAINYLDKNDFTKLLDCYHYLFTLIMRTEDKEVHFDSVYNSFCNIFIEIGKSNQHQKSLKATLNKVFDLVILLEDIKKIDDLIIALESIINHCGEMSNVAFYLYDVYEELLSKQSYFKVMHCEIKGEGAQAKALLIKKLKLDDVGIAKVISESIGIAETTAYSYLNRSRIPSASFHTFIEETFDCEYSEIIQSPDEQILGALERISLNLEDYYNTAGLEKVRYFYKKSIDFKYYYGEVFALSCLAILKFYLKQQECFNDIKIAIGKAKKIDFELLTFSITMQAHMFIFSGRSEEAVKSLELHRKKINQNVVSENVNGKFYYELGLGYRRIKNFSKAKRFMEVAYDNAITLKAKSRRMNIIGLILRNQGKLVESIRLFKKIFEISSNKVEHAIAYNNIAYSYLQLNEFEIAFEMVEKAIELVSDVKLINRRIHYYDTLFELILLTNSNYEKFVNLFDDVERDFHYLDGIYEYYGAVLECIRKMVKIIIRQEDHCLMNRLIIALKEASEFYDNTVIEKEVRLIFADSMINFINGSMFEEVKRTDEE